MMKPAPPANSLLQERTWVNPEASTSPGTPSVIRPRAGPAGSQMDREDLPSPAIVYNPSSKSFESAPMGVSNLPPQGFGSTAYVSLPFGCARQGPGRRGGTGSARKAVPCGRVLRCGTSSSR
jgi:hypothetical protein